MGRGSATGSSSFRPHLETLEDRCLPSSQSFVDLPVVPEIDPGTKAFLRGVLVAGMQAGNRPHVFAKVGDSITAMPEFLTPLGSPRYNPIDPALVGWHLDLAATIEYFRFEPLEGNGLNSFNHSSVAAQPGWTTIDLLNPFTAPLDVELSLTRPGFALILVGTNDLYFGATPQDFRDRLGIIVAQTLSRGVIPVLSTIPDDYFADGMFAGMVPAYNQAVADIADAYSVPLWNYWRALQGLPGNGLSADGVHPSSFPLGSGFFTADALLFGFNVRNLTAIQVLDKLRRVVLEDGPPDCPPGAVPAAVRSFITGAYQAVLGRAPAAAELGFWGPLVHCGYPRHELTRALWVSPEHRGQQVDALYRKYLGQAPDPFWRAFWVSTLQAGVTEADVERTLLMSPAYTQRHASEGAFITQVFNDLLGFKPGLPGIVYWQQVLQAGARRADVVQYLVLSPPRTETVVQQSYQAYLGRPAAGAEVQAWTGLIQTGLATTETFAQAVVGADEFWRLQIQRQ